MSDVRNDVSPSLDGVQFKDYLRVVYRRRWLAAAVFLAVVTGVGVYTYVQVPMYEAKTSILIELDAPKVVNFEEVLDEGERFANYYQTQYELLGSRALARRTVAALNLTERGDFGAVDESQAVAAILQNLEITPVRLTRLVEVRFQSADPKLAAEVANAHAHEYIEQSLENRFLASKDAGEWLEAQLAEERKRVEEMDSALQTFREQNNALSLRDGQDIVVRKLTDLNAAVTRAKTGRIEKESEFRELMAAQAEPGMLESFPAILSNSFIQQLKGQLAMLQREYAELSQTLGERHPTLVEKRTAIETTAGRLSAEVDRVVESVRNGYRAAQAEEASLTRALEEQKREALALNRRGIEYAALEREAESVRLVYQSLLQRAKETGVSRELRSTNVRIIDEAEVPANPASPRVFYNLALALMGGSLLAVGAVFGVAFLDDRIKTPDDVRIQLGVSFLGLLPEVGQRHRGTSPLLGSDVPGPFVEAVRAMRTGLIASLGSKGPRSVIVASSVEGEGKTLVASSLAIALAQAQERVLLVDADMRRPRVHDIFSYGTEPGLSNVLGGTATLAEALRPTAVPGLSIISAGTPSLQAPELLGAEPFTDLFEILQEHFTWVIIDTPPLLQVTDASIVARRATGVVFVVGSGMTSAKAARLALEELRRAGGRLIGTVLNRADLKHHPFYFAPYTRGDSRPDASAPPPRRALVAGAHRDREASQATLSGARG